MLESDYPSGRFGFAPDSRFPVVTVGRISQRLVVRRQFGNMDEVAIQYKTVSVPTYIDEGVQMNPAISNNDYRAVTGDLVFKKGEVKKHLYVCVSVCICYRKSKWMYV